MSTNIVFEGTTNREISYLYNALGQKLQKKVVNASTDDVTDYVNGYQYLNTNLEFFVHAEGYVKYTPPAGRGLGIYSYVFNYTDHLGNIRVSYGKDPATNVLKILEENHYYPFGLKHKNYNSDKLAYVKEEEVFKLKPINTIPPTYKYKYNGKELQDELGLNMYDYGARNYDVALGRWMNVDPLAEKAPDWTPYRAFFNNPLRYTDPTGMYENEDWYVNNESGDIEWFPTSGERNGYINMGDSRCGTITGGTSDGIVSFELRNDGSFSVGGVSYEVGDSAEVGSVVINSHTFDWNEIFSIKGGFTIWGEDRSGDTSGLNGITTDSFESSDIPTFSNGNGRPGSIFSKTESFFDQVCKFLGIMDDTGDTMDRVSSVVEQVKNVREETKPVKNDTLKTLYYGGPNNTLQRTEKSVNGKKLK